MKTSKTPTESSPKVLLGDDACLEHAVALMHDLASGGRDEVAGRMVREHLKTGGKRLRARLALAACETLGTPRDHAIGWAASCELVHNATLVHDDLQDRDEKRRGAPTVWVLHGDVQAINAGDLLFMLPFMALAHIPVAEGVRWRLAQAVAERTAEVVRGQACEQELGRIAAVSWEAYERAVRGKTSALFELPVLGAALIAGHEPAAAAALAQPFGGLGVLFQMQDDVLDLYGDKGRGFAGSDIYEGKVSCLVVEHGRLHPDENAHMLSVLRLPRDATPAAEVERLIARFRDGGALAAVIARIRELEHTIAQDPALRGVPLLHELATELLAVALGPIRHVLEAPLTTK